MKTFASLLLIIVMPFFASSCNQSSQKTSTIPITTKVITHVNIIDVRDGSISRGHVVIDSGRIQQILRESEDESEVIQEAEIINGEGKFLLPGIAEMHAHLPSVIWNDPQMEEILFLYLSNGITTVRGMLGHPLHLELREKVKQGEMLGPRIYTSSPSLNGNTVTTPEEAIEQVKAYQKEGYDFLKLHPGLRLHVFDQIVTTANEVNIPFAGHVSTLVGIRHALHSKYASIDHMDGFLEGLVPEKEEVNSSQNGFFGYNFTMKADTSLLPDLVALSKENEVWVVPTQSLFTRWFSPSSAESLAREPEMKYIAPELIENWVTNKRNLVGNETYKPSQWEQFIELRKKILLQLQKNGYGLLLGSDAPQVFNVPGFSIQHEMQAMAAAGLSPLEILQTGTLNPAKFFDAENEFGEIKVGASADLILLNQNPLDNIKNMEQPEGVMVKGEWLSRQEIDRRLKEIDNRYDEAKIQ
ncbi:amidohydrolase family protein [Echinicola pacifica]|nr:amidohydrolase family protein [Echinicola pacifica]